MQAVAPQPTTVPATRPTTRRVENHDEGRAWYRVLPNPFITNNGQIVRDAQTWYSQRRPKILAMFEHEIYGRAPQRPADEWFEVVETSVDALGGKAIRKQISVHLTKQTDGAKIDVLMYLPANAKKQVPVFLCFSFFPLQRVMDDPAIHLQQEWKPDHTRHDGTVREVSKSFQINEALEHGYGVAVIYYAQIDPDFDGGMPYGVRAGYLVPGQTHFRPDEWGTIAAWAWGASRALDYLETDPQVDANRVAIMGHSRLGKTALWAGANDTRFAMVVACSSGRGGASLARRDFGESIGDLAQRFGYQFCGNFQKYSHHENDMPVDTHELLGLIAPRPLYLATASEDLHSDPRGEFEAAIAAGPIYSLLGAKPLHVLDPPPLDTAVMDDIGYHCHAGKHEVTALDWKHILEFADVKFGGKK